MSETVITVQGSHTARHPAERAALSAAVEFDGEDREPVFARATEVASGIETDLRDLVGGAVTHWSADRVRVWSQRPWNDEGRQLPPVYHAHLGVSATFVDVDALARWVETWATVSGVRIGGITWQLSEESERAAHTAARGRAVADAVSKAQEYATALGLGTVSPIAIADPGMLGEAGRPEHGVMNAMTVSSTSRTRDGGTSLSFTPEDIEVTAAVDARFFAR